MRQETKLHLNNEALNRQESIEKWSKEVTALKNLYEQVFKDSESVPGEFLYKEFGNNPKVLVLDFLAPKKKGTTQGFYEKMSGAGIPRILRFLKDSGIPVAGAKVTVDDEESLRKLTTLLKGKPSIRIVGISSFTCEIDFATKTAQTIKEVMPNVKLVLGGPHADIAKVSEKAARKFYGFKDGWDDDSELKRLEMYFDHIIAGSGETALRDLLRSPDMPTYIKTGSPEGKKELAEYIPPLKVLNQEAGIFPLFPGYTGLASFLGTEGCPYKCSFCTSPLTSERKWQERKGEIPKLVAEIKKHPANLIWLHSETLSIDWLRKFAQEMIKQDVSKRWQFMPRIDSFLDKKRAKNDLALLKKSGCLQMVFGVESPDIKISRSYNKPIEENTINSVLKKVAEAGIIPRTFIVIGGEYETENSLRHFIEWGKQSPALAFRISFLTPFMGTPEWFKAEKNNRWIDNERRRFVHHSTLEPVIKCPAIMDKSGKGDRAKLEHFKSFPEKALREIYNSQEYCAKIVNFIKNHPDMALIIRGMLYLFERQGLVDEKRVWNIFNTN